MKQILFVALLTLMALGNTFAQVPTAFNYQAVAHDSFGTLLTNRNVSVRFTLSEGVAPGTPQYVETQTATTNQFGLFTLKVGMGTPTFGSMNAVNWLSGNIYLLVEYDQDGGTNYLNMGATQMLSVPYALYAGYTANDSAGVNKAGWLLTGNAGTTYGTNFIGTTDNADVMFKVDNIPSGFIQDSMANTAFGVYVFNSNTSGTGNTALGANALFLNTTGSANVALGVASLYNNPDRSGLVAIGDSALYNNGIGTIKAIQAIQNTAIGSSALFSNTVGAGNTSVGYNSLYSSNFGDFNTAVGTYTLSANTSGTANTAIGYNSLASNTGGNYNTAVGYNAFDTGTNLVNSTALGYEASVDSSNQVQIGNTSVTSIGGQVSWTTYSDGRVKNNIQENVPGLSFLKALRPVTYNYSVQKEDQLLGRTGTNNWPRKYDIEKTTFTGFIAQEVDAAAGNLGYNFSGVDKRARIWGIRYSDFVPTIVKGIQEQQDMIDKQGERILKQQEQIDELTKEIEGLKGLLKSEALSTK